MAHSGSAARPPHEATLGGCSRVVPNYSVGGSSSSGAGLPGPDDLNVQPLTFDVGFRGGQVLGATACSPVVGSSPPLLSVERHPESGGAARPSAGFGEVDADESALGCSSEPRPDGP
eukprot:14367599-Alexandrium_andersonii.AAC.1